MNTTALLLIDIQNDYFDGGANPLHQSQEAATQASKVLAHFRQKGWPVIHIQHESTRPDATFFKPGTQGMDIYSLVAPINGEEVVIKHFPNSFRDTQLLSLLQNKGIQHLVVAGMMTHMCVDATVRAAKDLGFTITLLGDACATKSLSAMGQTADAPSVQTALLGALGYFYAGVMTSEQFIQKR